VSVIVSPFKNRKNQEKKQRKTDLNGDHTAVAAVPPMNN